MVCICVSSAYIYVVLPCERAHIWAWLAWFRTYMYSLGPKQLLIYNLNKVQCLDLNTHRTQKFPDVVDTVLCKVNCNIRTACHN